MAAKQNSWTMGTLKSRGWTEDLAKQLLPKPFYRHFNGRAVRSWRREEVLLAEESESFLLARQAMEAGEEPNGDCDPETALRAAGDFLAELWAKAPKPPEENLARLAGYLHAALRQELAKNAWASRLKGGQAAGYIGNFLALEHITPGTGYYTALRRFTNAGVWLGRNLSSPAAQRLQNRYGAVLTALAERILGDFVTQQPAENVTGCLEMDNFPCAELLSHPLEYIWSVIYVPRAIRTSLNLLVALQPKDEYPEARAMKRHFIIHVGGTNTGKTYAGFQRLMEAETGVYLAPLRLLALEAQEVLLDAHVRCSLTTGEEEDVRPGDTHVAATAEKLDLHRAYEVAVVDECQMIADRQRGYAWTRAILGVLAPEVHLCCAPEARSLLVKIIRSCGDSYEIVTHQRKTPLVCMDRAVEYSDLRPGDALITFSKTGVLSIAEDLRSRGKKPAIIYGALPYATRRKQMESFLNGDTRYVVSTDAIGMGLNLPIRRIIFMETEKFDGTERRPLRPEEIRQIAGRAGRYGMYDTGYVGAAENLPVIQAGLEAEVPPLQYAVVGFSELIMQVDFDLLEVLEVWNRMTSPEPFRRLDISRYITVITRLRETGFRLTREQELRAANIPYDETDEELNRLFAHFLRAWQRGEAPERPALREKNGAYTLPELEEYCRKLDLWFSFSKAFGFSVNQEELYAEREKTAESINSILLHNLKNNIRFCAACGAALPLRGAGRLCERCYSRRMRGAKIRRR